MFDDIVSWLIDKLKSLKEWCSAWKLYNCVTKNNCITTNDIICDREVEILNGEGHGDSHEDFFYNRFAYPYVIRHIRFIKLKTSAVCPMTLVYND